MRWARAFVPLSSDERQRAASALDPSGRTKDVGATLKLEIELPNVIISDGLLGRARGTKSSKEGERATLVVPLEIATTEGDPIIWHLTWQK